MDDQALVEHLAQFAKPRLMDLLKLKVEHVYDPTPGNIGDGWKMVRTEQPYKGIDRFVVDDKIIGYIVNPGLLPIAKAISLDVRGRRQLMTRKLKSAAGRTMAHMDGFGVGITIAYDPAAEETRIIWECAYRVE